MGKMVMVVLIVICAVAIITGFFMPWATAGASAGKLAKGVTGAAAGMGEKAPFVGGLFGKAGKVADKVASAADVVGIKMSVSGYDIPQMMNTKSSQVAVALAGIFIKDAKDADKKSYAVYLMPVLALVCVGLALWGMKNWIPAAIMAVLSGGISLGGLYTLMTTNMSNMAVQITIQNGLWQTLYAYLLICVVGVVWVVTELVAAKK
jgi:hypothetical protein